MDPALFLIIVILFIIVVWLISSSKKETERICQFCARWDVTVCRALSEISSLKGKDGIFSDGDKRVYQNNYKDIKKAYSNLEKPNKTELLKQLEKYEVFIKEYSSIEETQFNHNLSYFNPIAKVLLEEYTAIRSQKSFVAHYEITAFYKKWLSIVNEFCGLSNHKKYSNKPYFNIFEKIQILFRLGISSMEEDRKNDNVKYKQSELERHKLYFDTVFKYPLDEQQRNAIVTQEDNTLVVSSAGSGKTSTIVAKVRYLVYRKLVNPKDILVVTYTNKAVEQLQERMGIKDVACVTINKHAIDTIGKITKSKPTIVESSVLFGIFEKHITNDPDFIIHINKYITEYSNLIKKDVDYKTSEEYYADVLKYGLLTPYKDASGERVYVKSKQEWLISIILSQLGVKYKYEAPYLKDTSSENRRNYKPDFTIYYPVVETDELGHTKTVEKKLYLEHFGVDSNGNVPRWFGNGLINGYDQANKNYKDGIIWKRQIHEKYGTVLIETTSADFIEKEDIDSYIEQLLNEHGVKTRHLSEEEKIKLLKDANPSISSSLFNLIKGFITLMKANKKTLDEIINSIDKDDVNSARNIIILDKIIRPIYDEYQKRLQESNLYDFTDTLLKAAELCSHHNPYKYRYILVDEFQDISMDKYIYLNSLRLAEPYTSFFCVGDDWQSIYRFSGSDMTLFYDFSKFFGYTEECKIETTHRFGQPLLCASSTFIQTNPEQKKKDVKTTATGVSNINVIPFEKDEELKAVKSIITQIPIDESILILGRYRFNAQALKVSKKVIESKEPIFISINNREIPYLTVHSSKGLEADHVIILNCESGVHGFPSLIEDDPILQYVLSGADSYVNAEERRVFYVAITRARKATYCLYTQGIPSPFISEFGYYSSDSNCTGYLCPHCKNGYVRVVKEGKAKNDVPYVSVNCTNNSCNYFENVFGAEISRFKPREVIDSIDMVALFSLFCRDYIWDDKYRVLLLKSDNKQCIGVIIPNSIVVNEYFWELLRTGQLNCQVSTINHNDGVISFLVRGEDKIYIGDHDLNIKHLVITQKASDSQLKLVSPIGILDSLL